MYVCKKVHFPLDKEKGYGIIQPRLSFADIDDGWAEIGQHGECK